MSYLLEIVCIVDTSEPSPALAAIQNGATDVLHAIVQTLSIKGSILKVIKDRARASKSKPLHRSRATASRASGGQHPFSVGVRIGHFVTIDLPGFRGKRSIQSP
jgi:hypothetical protein